MFGPVNNLEPAEMTTTDNLGYALLPKSHENSPGYSGLVVTIRQLPTANHYDPESISVWIRDQHNVASQTSLTLESHCSDIVAVCPGAVILTDRHNKRVDFFTFGGSLETVTGPSERVFHIHSPAPILEIFDDRNSFSDQLAFEVEGLLAKAHALWALDDEGFARQLAQVDPFQAYLASLQEILGRYERNRDLRSSWQGFYGKLTTEKDWLVQEGLWPATIPGLVDLMAPTDADQDRT